MRLPSLREGLKNPDRWAYRDFFGDALTLACFDLQYGQIRSWESFQFLYERLLGQNGRKWVLSLFQAAMSSPEFCPRGYFDDYQHVISTEQLVECVETRAGIMNDLTAFADLQFLPQWDLGTDGAPLHAL